MFLRMREYKKGSEVHRFCVYLMFGKFVLLYYNVVCFACNCLYIIKKGQAHGICAFLKLLYNNHLYFRFK